jgi:hypothetical protein
MANADAAFGLRPMGLNVDKQTNIYAVDATSASAIYLYDPVTLTGTADANGIPEVRLCTIADTTTANMSPIMGVVVGVASSKEGTQLQDDNKYIAATPGAGKYVIVCDDPDATFAVQEDGNLGVAGVGNNFRLVIAAGNATSGISKTEIDSSTAGANVGLTNVKVLRLIQSPDNAVGTNANWEVQIADHQLRGPTAGV